MILLILILFFQSTNISVYAYNDQTYYARILYDQVYLYKSPLDNNSIDNIYFELPKTYFVELINKQGNFYEARYLDFIGYVKKDSVQAVASTPKNPFLNNINFRVYAELSQNLWSSPSNENPSNLITEIPALTKNIQYIGKITGSRLIEGRTNIWYFCKYSNNSDYYGYIYSDFCDEMNIIQNNIEELTYINNPSFQDEILANNSIPQESNIVGVVVAILSVPALIFMFMIIRGTRIISGEKIKGKEVVDY